MLCSMLIKNIYSNNNIGHGVTAPYPIYTRITDYKEENNKYVVSAKFVFTIDKGDGPTSLDLYYKYNDVATDKPFIKGPEYNGDYDINEYKNNIIMYILNNYSDIQSNLMTYTYTFEKVDNKLYLVDFNVK